MSITKRSLTFLSSLCHARPLVPLMIAGCAALSLGCGREAVVSADGLPLRRVVVYRNGVAYFERAGHVE